MTFRYVGPLSGLAGDAERAVVERSGADVDAALDVLRPLRDDVRARGDVAVLEAEARFGTPGATEGSEAPTLRGATSGPAALEVPKDELAAALARVPRAVVDALRAAQANLETFHRRQVRKDDEAPVGPGVVAGRRFIPLARVGCYVPGGRAAYPSTVLMTAVPARAAGVREVVVATPAGADGRVPDVTLAACAVAGVDRVFAMGGAQAVFALAYGTATVPRVDKIVGPGSVWVTAAKLLVAPRVAIDLPAGPSEVLVLADGTVDAAAIAWDLVAQAEHDPLAAAVLVTSDRALLDAVQAHVAKALASTPRREVVAAALASRGALLLAKDRTEALAFAERYAPEHLVLATARPEADLAALSAYGSAFLGPWSAVTFGDYCSGTNHVLPTGGLARSMSGLSVDDFLRRPTHQTVSAEGLRALAPVAVALAEAEGLPAHAEAVRVRLGRLP